MNNDIEDLLDFKSIYISGGKNVITGELKNKIDSLWDIFAAGGLTNPLDVIEQITYLMFIHDLDDTDNLRSKEAAMLGLPHKSIFSDEVQIGDRTIDGKQIKWSVFHDFPADRMYSVMQEWVFPFIKNCLLFHFSYATAPAHLSVYSERANPGERRFRVAKSPRSTDKKISLQCAGQSLRQ